MQDGWMHSCVLDIRVLDPSSYIKHILGIKILGNSGSRIDSEKWSACAHFMKCTSASDNS